MDYMIGFGIIIKKKSYKIAWVDMLLYEIKNKCRKEKSNVIYGRRDLLDSIRDLLMLMWNGKGFI